MHPKPQIRILLTEIGAAATDASALLADETALFVRGLLKAIVLLPALLLLVACAWIALSFATAAIAHWWSGSLVVVAMIVLGLHVGAIAAVSFALRRWTRQASFPETRRVLSALRSTP